MAIGAQIYKFTLNLSDMDRNLYETVGLTVALHPSETRARMVARLLAFCCCYETGLEFTKGLSTPEMPDAWQLALDGSVNLWVQVGEPSVDVLKSASRKAQKVMVYSFNTKGDVWWQQVQGASERLKVNVFQLPNAPIHLLGEALKRTNAWSITITDGQLWVATEEDSIAVPVTVLQAQ